ncbi:hypothetical protein [Brevibacillus sp. SIMBA_040]|uniref:hypothetical protein n=1 Tax=unclassified Brevibacillus TaxID=2684853 RepID=UPI00397C39F3
MFAYETKHWMLIQENLHVLPERFRNRVTERLFGKLQLHNDTFYVMFQRINVLFIGVDVSAPASF